MNNHDQRFEVMLRNVVTGAASMFRVLPNVNIGFIFQHFAMRHGIQEDREKWELVYTNAEGVKHVMDMERTLGDYGVRDLDHIYIEPKLVMRQEIRS